MNIAIIPARGGSKRIPRKNIKPFLGKPIISYPLSMLQDSGLFSRIIVSSDDEEILDFVKQFSAEPLKRPAHLSDDYSITRDVIKHCIEELKLQHEQNCNVCCVYPTAVLLQDSTIKTGLKSLEKWIFSFPIVEFDAPVWRGFTRENEGSIKMLYPEHLNTRSQDLPSIWHDAGQFYWGSAQAWLGGLALFGAHSYGVAIRQTEAQDIDTMQDWAIAELKYQLLRQ